MIKIDKGVAMPARSNPHAKKYDWRGMKKGDSFEYQAQFSTGYSLVSKMNARLAPKHFTLREFKGKPRIWRDK